MELKLINEQGQEASRLAASDLLFAREYNEALVHQVLVAYQANARSGDRAQKDRHDVRHTTKKPWRQKGTGRARVGTIRSPLWRGGGTIFGPTPRTYAFTVPKKVRRLALISALSMKVREEKLLVLKDFPLAEAKTKAFKEVLDRFGLKKTLVVIDRSDETLEKSSRNLPDVKMMRCEGINVYDLLKYDSLVLLEPSIQKIEGALA